MRADLLLCIERAMQPGREGQVQGRDGSGQERLPRSRGGGFHVCLCWSAWRGSILQGDMLLGVMRSLKLKLAEGLLQVGEFLMNRRAGVGPVLGRQLLQTPSLCKCRRVEAAPQLGVSL